MDTDLNHGTLTGVLERDRITRFADHGTQQVPFMLRLEEPGPAGQAFQLFVPVEAYKQGAETAGDLSAGDGVLVAGKLKWTSWTTKSGEKRSAGVAHQGAGAQCGADRPPQLGASVWSRPLIAAV